MKKKLTATDFLSLHTGLKISLVLLQVLLLLPHAIAQPQDTTRHEVMLETTKGNIRIALYNETPLHRDNFIKLVKNKLRTTLSLSLPYFSYTNIKKRIFRSVIFSIENILQYSNKKYNLLINKKLNINKNLLKYFES